MKNLGSLTLIVALMGILALQIPSFSQTAEISLNPGWNLISFGMQPSSQSIEVIFNSVPAMKYVMGFMRNPADEGTEGFKTYMNLESLKDFSTLTTMDGYHGYWVYMNQAATLEVTGTAITDTMEWTVSQGWNLTGYWLSSSNSLPTLEIQTGTVIDSIFNQTSIDGVVKYIMGFYRGQGDGGSEGFRSFMNNPAITFSNLSKLDPKHGYWFYMDGPGVLKYLSGLPARTLTGITISPSSINLNPAGTYNLRNTAVTATFSNGSEETVTSIAWTKKSGGGTISENIFTAPGSEGTTGLLASLTLRNITATAELSVTITAAPLPMHLLTVTLSPAEALTAGAQWSMDGGINWKYSGDTVELQENTAYTLECKTLSSWASPAVITSVMGSSDTVRTLIYTAASGAAWTLATGTAQWSVRGQYASLVFDNKMWVMGGALDTYGLGSLNDVWNSTDGVTWVQAGTAAWSARSAFTALTFNDRIWLLAGYDTGSSHYKNDVWSSTDGIAWTRATAGAPFTARSSHASVVFDNRIWMLGGWNGTNQNDVWYSMDGATWKLATAGAAWSARDGHSCLVFDNKIWVFGGSSGGYKNDVWYSS
ncbi:MAG: hypothetical protein PHW04_08435, partial [Candidatus Wallbacteria bacterium]|nr:hypothetical protein [Candidatus Wallbacteria bacterium]